MLTKTQVLDWNRLGDGGWKVAFCELFFQASANRQKLSLENRWASAKPKKLFVRIIYLSKTDFLRLADTYKLFKNNFLQGKIRKTPIKWAKMAKIQFWADFLWKCSKIASFWSKMMKQNTTESFPNSK